jgi:hypothetical protein
VGLSDVLRCTVGPPFPHNRLLAADAGPRFQAGDLYHYFFKLFQMSTFTYIGAASGNWNPGHIQDPGSLNMTGFEAAQQSESFPGGRLSSRIANHFPLTQWMLYSRRTNRISRSHHFICRLTSTPCRPIRHWYDPLVFTSLLPSLHDPFL